MYGRETAHKILSLEREESGVHRESIDPYCRGLSLKRQNALGDLRRFLKGPRGSGHHHKPPGVDPEVKGSP